MKFKYAAKKGLDEIVTGVADAPSRDELLQRLVDQGLFPISAEPVGEQPKAAPAEESGQIISFSFTRPVSHKDIALFAQKLAVLMRAKLELLAAMRIVAEQTEPHSAFREVADAICAVLRQGKPFSEALSKFPKHFSPLFVSIVKAGETSGGLSDALTQINAYLTRQEAMRRKVFSALAYPVILLFVGAGSIVVLMTVVIPKLKPIFATMGGKIPLVTKIILAASDLSRDGALAIALAFVLAVYALYTQRSSAWFTHLTHTLKRRMPLVSGLVCDQEYAHLSRSLGMLIRSRVSVLQALSVARHTVSDPRLSRGLEAVCDAVGAGESLAKSLERMTDLPPFFVKMVAVGEESGRLGEVLDEVTATYTDQVEGHIAVLSSMLEPLMILCMGTILGGIVLSVLIPMFQLTQAVG